MCLSHMYAARACACVVVVYQYELTAWMLLLSWLLLLLQCSNWGADQLTTEQLQYAALDAWLGLQLAVQLHQLALEQQVPATQCTTYPAAGASDVSETEIAAAALAGHPSAELARFLAPYVLQASSSSNSNIHGNSRRTDGGGMLSGGPVLLPKAGKSAQRSMQQQNVQLVPLLPWLLPVLQQHTGCAGAGAHTGHSLEQQQQQQHDVQDTQQQQQQQQGSHQDILQQQQRQARALLQAAQQQLHLQQYCKAFPQLQSLLQQQRQLQLRQLRSVRRKHRQQATQQQQQDVASQQQAALLQQRRQRQLEQLQRLGQAAAALPSRNVFAKMQQLKPARLPTRKSAQYENCRILAPDGRPLATCGIKKVSLRLHAWLFASHVYLGFDALAAAAVGAAAAARAGCCCIARIVCIVCRCAGTSTGSWQRWSKRRQPLQSVSSSRLAAGARSFLYRQPSVHMCMWLMYLSITIMLQTNGSSSSSSSMIVPPVEMSHLRSEIANLSEQ
jgi:hypothetical protein